MAKPDEAAQLAVKRAIDGTDRAQPRDHQAAQRRQRLRADAPQGLGTMDLASLQAAADTYRKLGLVQKPLEVQGDRQRPAARPQGRRGMNFAGKMVLVTGASRGIGAAIARAFAAEQATVAVNYLRNAKRRPNVVVRMPAAGAMPSPCRPT